MDITVEDVPAIVRLLAKISREREHPLGLKISECNEWAKGLESKNLGEVGRGLYTGCLYQAIPAIELAVSLIEKVDLERVSSLTSLLARGAGVLRVLRRSREWVEALKKIYMLLEDSGVDVGYSEVADVYSGILFYDLGMIEAYEDRISKVISKFEELRVSEVVTVDPHTTIAMIEGVKMYNSRIRVKHYVELLDPEALRRKYDPIVGRVVIHDPCHLARDLKLHGKLRELLNAMNVETLEPEEAGEETQCCGGPLEMLDPKTSIEIGGLRVKELSNVGVREVVAPCPICVANLRRAVKKLKMDMEILDLPQLFKVRR